MKHQPADSSEALRVLGLQQPVRVLTKPRLDERRVRGMWHRIERASHGQPGWQGLLAPTRLLPAVALALLLLVGWGMLRPFQPSAPHGPLVTAEGQRFESIEASGQQAARVSFADGSQIEAAPGARVEGLAATASEFVVLLRRGQARFAVTPGGPRRWLIEARGARVEVVGTAFSVESQAGSFSVRVESGVVLVRSPLLADGVQRLGAGQALHLDLGQATEAALGVTSGREQQPRDTPAAEARPRPDELAVKRAREQNAREPLRARRRPATSAAQRSSAQPPADSHVPDSAVELWEQADAARRAGHAARAAQLLQELIEAYPRDSQAGLAAYTLGVLQLEQLAAPRAAAQRFRQALELGIAAGLRESCYLRQAEALRHAGDTAAARQIARQYLRGFPLGEHRDAMERLLTAPGSMDGTHGTRGGRTR
jgi:TolA-binding protein